MKVHVLGCGPAGLLIAHQAAMRDLEVVIHSIKIPSDIKGAQFIHEPVSGITSEDPEMSILFDKWGHKKYYAEKVYGDQKAPCSWDDFDGEWPAWSMINVYAELWSIYERSIVDTEVRAPYIQDLIDSGDMVFSTITPLGYCLKPQDHSFEWQQVWINDSCSIPSIQDDQNVILYNGSLSESWYRSSMIGGYGSTEWGQKPLERAKLAKKPLSTDCDCFIDEGLVRLGRFGEFRKAILVNHAYNKAGEILDAV